MNGAGKQRTGSQRSGLRRRGTGRKRSKVENDKLPFWLKHMPYALRGWLFHFKPFLKYVVNIPGRACRLKREPELKVEVQRLIVIPKHKFTDRGDGQCETCQGPL